MTEMQSRLAAMSDASYKVFQSGLLPTLDPTTILGVRIPALRSFAKTLSREQATDFLNVLPHRYYDENNLHALLIARIPTYDMCVEAVERFLPYVDNWATCDMLRPRVFAKHKTELFGKCRVWIASAHPFTVRFGLEMLMVHGLGEAFDPVFLEWAAHIRSEDYYVRMMVAWFFATALTKRYEETVPYLLSRRLETWVHKKAIQKACESRAIPADVKMYLKTLKG